MGCKCITSEPEIDTPKDEVFASKSTNLKSKRPPNSERDRYQDKETPNPYETNNFDTNFNGTSSFRDTQAATTEIISHDVFKAKKPSPVIKGYPTDSYSAYLYDNINMARKNPSSMINSIESAMDKIVLKKIKKNDGTEEERYIFASKVKVALYRGRPAFEEAIDFLRNQEQVAPLFFDESICVKVPENEEDIKDKEYMIKKVEEINAKEVTVLAYWRVIVKHPETSFMMMLVDDNAKGTMRKLDIFNKEFTRIGITSTMIGKMFAAYITFAK